MASESSKVPNCIKENYEIKKLPKEKKRNFKIKENTPVVRQKIFIEEMNQDINESTLLIRNQSNTMKI